MRVNGINCFRAEFLVNNQKQNRQNVSFDASLKFLPLKESARDILVSRVSKEELLQIERVKKEIADTIAGKHFGAEDVLEIRNQSKVLETNGGYYNAKQHYIKPGMSEKLLSLTFNAEYTVLDKTLLALLEKYKIPRDFLKKEFLVSKIMDYRGSLLFSSPRTEFYPAQFETIENCHSVYERSIQGLAKTSEEIKAYVNEIERMFKLVKDIPEFLKKYPVITTENALPAIETVTKLTEGSTNRVKFNVIDFVSKGKIRVSLEFDKSANELIDRYIVNPDAIYIKEIPVRNNGNNTGKQLVESTSKMLEFLVLFEKAIKEIDLSKLDNNSKFLKIEEDGSIYLHLQHADASISPSLTKVFNGKEIEESYKLTQLVKKSVVKYGEEVEAAEKSKLLKSIF